ncbi:MAG TPA: autotransporter domain-containing protein, partial [Chlamydiales bacterium]|nr:autotransporter domain-containing protein [Chlamydiales bacterium]
GSGTFTLTASSTYNTTTIQAGRLNVISPANVTTNVTASGGTLGGTGTITGSVHINASGAITPGTSIGTLSIINGPLTLDSGSTTNIEINPTSTSIIAISGAPGSASLSGTLHATVDPGSYTTPLHLVFLTATGGVTGTFNTLVLSPPMPGFFPVVVYGATFAALDLFAISTFNLSQFQGNEAALANYLNSFQFNPDYAYVLFTLLSLPFDEQAMALDAINPARNGFDFFTTANVIYSFGQTIDSRLSMYRIERLMQNNLQKFSAAPELTAVFNRFNSHLATAEDVSEDVSENLPEGSIRKAAEMQKDDYCIWVNGFGNFAAQDEQSQLPGFYFNSEGALVSCDSLALQNGFAGAAFGYARTSLRFKESLGTGGVNSYFLGFYGSADFLNAYIEPGFFATANQNQGQRRVAFPGFMETYYSSHRSYQLTPHLAFGYNYQDSRFHWNIFAPFAMFDFIVNWEKGYKEKGQSEILAMRVKSKISYFLRSEVGLKAYQYLDRSWGYCVLKEAVSYVNQTPFQTTGFTAAIVNQAGSYTLDIFTRRQNLLTLGFEAMVKGNNGCFGSIVGSGEFFSGYVSGQAQAQFGKYF